MYAVIMAGGSGTRLWPKSRRRQPKQFQKLVSEQTMLQDTVRRITPLAPLDHVYVVASANHEDEIRAELPDVPQVDILLEPLGRNTAPCIGLAALHLMRRDPDAVVAFMAADSFIALEQEFQRVLRLAVSTVEANPGAILMLGITPTAPETGYGYIKASQPLEANSEVLRVERFVEKPDLVTALSYLAAGDYLWNSGMFVCRASDMLAHYQRLAPEIYAGLMRIAETIGTPREREVLAHEYEKFPKISVDYAIIEKTQDVMVIPANIGWSDVGSWGGLKDVLVKDQNENLVQGKGKHIHIDTTDCVIHSDRLVATVGLQGIVIMDTEDVLLVCTKERSQEVGKILAELEKSGFEKYL